MTKRCNKGIVTRKNEIASPETPEVSEQDREDRFRK